MRGELPIDDYVTHNFSGLELVNKAIEVLHDGTCLRAIININEQPVVKSGLPRLMSSNRFGPNGSIKRFTHWSESNQCDMTFSIYIP